MNCNRVEKLLPLYVGRDLDAQQEQMITAHIQSCSECATEADEFRQSHQLIQQVQAPAFSDDSYAEVRKGVWQQIEAKSNAASPWDSFAALFQPRLAWTAAAAVLIAVLALGAYFIGKRKTVSRDEVSKNQPVQRKEQAVAGSPDNRAVPKRENERIPGGRQVGPRTQKRRFDRFVAPDRATSLPVNSPDAFSSIASATGKAGDGSSDKQEKSLRVEMQTKDPNIRIIWFTPRDSKPASPNSKGT